MTNPKLEKISFDTIAKAVKNCTTPTRTVQSFSSQEKLFLISWLSDDLEIENKNPTLNHSTINLIKTIIMKLKGGK
jgi:hypothetical protein|tara:strand:- start:309 stop:536 length:228 start_codon:yes stop_codon:yes gene_type:complete